MLKQLTDSISSDRLGATMLLSQGENMIRKALPEESPLLTEVAFSSKRYWHYPESYMDIWRSELTITEDYIISHDVYVFETRRRIVGFYSLVSLEQDMHISGNIIPKGTWLDHMFVLPDQIGRTVGSQLFGHMCSIGLSRAIKVLHILVDPYAKGFYEKMGCRYVGEFPSSIADRTTPLFRLNL